MVQFFNTYDFFYNELKKEIVPRKYFYIDNGTYMNKLLSGEISEAMQIYWREMLFRIHFVATSSILRNAEWIDGIVFGIQTSNTMVFASSLRGLLEAVTDSFYSLDSVPFGIALNFNKIKKAVEGKADVPCYAGDLEKALIHFEFASKDKNNENKSLSAMRYITEYDESSNVDTKNLYKQLCNIVHPADGSLKAFKREVEVSDEISYSTIYFDEDTIIKTIWNENDASIKVLVKMSILLPLLCLKVLNELEFDDTSSKYIENCKAIQLIREEDFKKFKEMMELGEGYLK